MILYAYSGMLEFPGQELELSMPAGRGTKDPLGHLWVQAWTDNDCLNLRVLFREPFYIISSSGRSFSYGLGTLRRPSVRQTPSVNVCKCYRIYSKTTWPPSAIFDFFLVIASPQKLLDGFEWNLHIVFASMPSCASTEKIWFSELKDSYGI